MELHNVSGEYRNFIKDVSRLTEYKKVLIKGIEWKGWYRK